MVKPVVHILSDYEADWQALYVQGELVYESHSISAEDVLDALATRRFLKYVNQEFEWTNDEEAEDVLSNLPDNIAELAPYFPNDKLQINS